jgi:GAF domain-containing protein/DNA-binding response OmpR family regulator
MTLLNSCFKKLEYVLYSGLLFFIPFCAYSQSNAEKGLPFITNYLPKTYKALPQTWCVMEDNRGVMYFGIQNGILEYDGVKWRKVQFKNIPVVTRALAKDKNGRIYYGAIGDFGFLEQDSVGQTVGRSLIKYIPAAYRNFYDVWTIHAADEGVYFQSRELIVRLNSKNEVKVWKPKARFMYSFYIDDNYYVHEQGVGLFKMVNDSLQLIPGSEFLGQERMQVMLPYITPGEEKKTSEKKYLIGLFYSGLYLFDGKKFQPFASEASELLKSGTLYKGAKTKDGFYALSTTGKGLVVIDGNGKIIQQINRDVGLQDESVYAVYADTKGTLWLALDNGISRVETSSPLTQFTNQSGINTATLVIDRFKGTLFLGTTNGLLRFNEKTSKFEPVHGIPPNQTFTLLADNNNLLIPNDGLFMIQDGKVKSIQPSIGGNMQLAGMLQSNKYPNLLYGGATSGVKIFTKTSSGWKYLGPLPNLDDQVWTFSENNDGSVWVGTQSGVVYKITPAFDQSGQPVLSKFVYQRYGEEQGLQNAQGNVYKIKGDTWFPAEGGIYRFDSRRSTFYMDTSFGKFKTGGKEEFFIAEDKGGRVWLRFGKETIIATPQPNGKYRLDKTALLPIADRSFSSIYPEDNGITWICTTDGLVRFDEKLEKNYNQDFKTILRHVTAGNEVLNPLTGDSTSSSISFKNSTLRFEYAAPFFEQEDKTQYQTWLEGFESGWSGLDNNYYKEYTNLPDGQYKFHVKALNVYQKPSEETIYTFAILPPWWRTWWAYLLYGLAAVAAVYYLIRWRTRQLEAKHRELEHTVALRTAELSHRVEELAVINRVQEGLVSEMEMEGIYNMVGEKIREIFNAQVIDIVTYDKKTNLLEDHYSYEKGDRTKVGKWEPKGFRKHVIDTGQVFVINKDLDALSKKFDSQVIYGEQPKSAVFVPMISGGEVKGMISLQDLDKENAFSDSSVNLLTTLANSMSIALESARRFDETNRLLKETEQRTAELAVINSVQEGLAKELDMQAIYDLVGDRIRDVFNAQAVIIATLDQHTGVEEFKYLIEKGERFYLKPRPYDKLRQHLILTREKILINKDYEAAASEFGLKVLPGTEYPKSLLFVPLMTGDKVKSYVSLQNIDKENAFTESDVRLLETLANSMSVALENARLFDETNRLLKETEQRNAELAVINSVQESLVAQMDIKSIYELVGEKIREIFNAQVIDIVTYDPSKNLIEDQYAYEKGDRTILGPRAPKGFRKHVLETGELLLHNENVAKAVQEFENEILIGEMPKSQVYVPMIAGGKVKGVISLQNLDQEHAFSESNISLITTLANSMSVALESARLFDETTRLLKETEQRNAELAVINSVQESLVAEMDMNGIYELVGEKMREIFNPQVIDIVTYDSRANLIEDKYSFEKGDRTLVGPRKPKGFRKHVIETGHILLHNNNVERAMREFGNEILIGETPKSQIYVPMIAGGKVTGIISLQNIDHENAFSESDVSLLTTLANSMSVALESARLFDETNRLLKETGQRNAELAVITSVQESLVAQMDIQGIYDLVGEKMREIFNAQVIDIVTYDRKTNIIEDRYAYEKGDRTLLGPREPQGFRKHVIDSTQLLVINKDMDKLRSQYDNTVIVGQAAKSLVLVPMMAGGEVTGIISLQNLDQENAFSDSDINLLTTLVNSMSVALKSARLFDETTRLLKETEQRTGELAVINSVQEDLVREMDVQAIYDLVGNRISELFDTHTVIIRTLDAEKGMEQWRFALERGERFYNEIRPMIWANKQLISTREPLLINSNYLETAKKFGGTGVSKGQPPKSALFVPMIVGDVVKGSVSLQNIDKENAFTESDLRLLTTLTNSMSVALENARLFDETTHLLAEAKQRATELSTVNSISKALASQLNPDELIELVGNQMKDLFRANIVYLALLNQKTRIIHFPYQFGDNMLPIKLGEGLTSKIILTGEPLLINKDVEELRSHLGVQRVGIPAASYLGVPIPVGEDIIGVLSVQSTEHENSFNENDLRLLSTIAASVGVALRNAKLFEEVKQAKMEAEAASKVAEKANEAKSAFLSTVSHELRTPLTSVLGFTKIIRKRLEDKIFPALDRSDGKNEKTINQISENLNVVISEGERLTHLINDVLDLAKIEAGKMEWNFEKVSLPEVAERAIMATSSLFEQKSLQLVKNIDTNIPEISGDRDKLIQVIINLISNAVKFTDSGFVTCDVYRKKDELIVSITDTGIGIAMDDYSAVFEQFKQVGGDTLTDKPKGTGLGLPICKEIVEHHGGRIWLESEVGKGSTFSFALPVIQTENVQPIHLNELVKQLKVQMAQSTIQMDGQNSTILIVDDEEAIRSLLHQELSEAGYLIEEASNGKDALEKIRVNKPDLIILDVMMPEMNGFDLAAILKNDPQTMDIPIIVLSIVQDKARGYRIGVDRYLTKPIDTAQLFTEVGNLLEQGKSRKKVMVVDEDSAAVRSLTDVLQAKGYHVVESDGTALVQTAIDTQPDIIILNSVQSGKNEMVQALRFEKGLENVLFLMYQ